LGEVVLEGGLDLLGASFVLEDELGEGGGEGDGVAGLDLSGLLGEGRERDGEVEERDGLELEE
jgi:hypothetical protein|tara:strand:- start:1269 stop:1457 length:189 start_codon:yes stop_codon:yes gene_type:complete